MRRVRRLLYRLYEGRIQRRLARGPLPRHVAIIMDGNRRWARRAGLVNPSLGHQHGAEHVEEVLDWCSAAGIRHVTIFAASTENLSNRSSAEMDFLMGVIERVVDEHLTRPSSLWRLRIAGDLDLIRDSTARTLKSAEETTSTCATGHHLTVAIGYGGRQELLDAFRAWIDAETESGTPASELSDRLSADAIAAHLYTSGQPDPDLVIRTSGEQRLSGFLLWQTAYSELYFCDVYWPAFRHVDFLRALRAYAARQRRYGA
ncbi:polyprenyl diphosphate synthase [Streptomyces sp. N50]|uniref:polyprenyl diphosphate synthase n=1 Tax=Streptomyces sp. N50 TaxID=3081765 RepID=UPI002961F356|nr:polyprenyl diphosphate synthase [Streptomyces sp. N50]WOX17137.1 polyprenyl diphosphate synthase [Streptomyces sp. N50]